MSKNPDTISAKELCEYTGLTDQRHRQLAKANWFPDPVEGMYKRKATIRGVINYYQKTDERTRSTKEAIAQEKLKKEKRENDEAAKLLVLKSDVAEDLGKFITSALSFIRQKFENDLPMSMSGMGVPENRIIGERLYDDLAKRFRDELMKWKV